MSDRRSFARKVLYLCLIAALLLPISWLSAPAVKGGAERAGSPGGRLARLRAEHQLSQSNLGDIDPASETIKLATLGLRGVAANLLWEKANHYKKTEDWTNLSATLEQIAKLQPNFISVWQFQAWNLSYNVSVEFDDYRDRYYWVMRGIDFLKQGERYNRDNPRLLWDLGWFIAQKIGRADEHVQFRRMFREDDDFHPPERPRDRRDNWLVGKEWFLAAERAVVEKQKPLRIKGRGKSELIFFADAPMCQINYAAAIEEEGTHGEVARQAWKLAGEDWQGYGSQPILHTSGRTIRLNDMERLEAQSERDARSLDELGPGVRDEIRRQREASLSAEQKKAYETRPFERTKEQAELAIQAENLLRVTQLDVAQRIADDRGGPETPEGLQAIRLARSATRADQHAAQIRRYREIVNYDYWRTRCLYEQTDEALAARARIFAADRALAEADLVQAKTLYDEGIALWRRVLDQFATVVEDSITGDDLLDVIKRYRKVLEELDEPFPRDFLLKDIIQRHDTQGELRELFQDTVEEPPR